jgi:hypothetical protein
MKWFDWMSLAIVLGTALIQKIRTSKAGGMGLAFFEMGGLIVSAIAANALAMPLAQAIGIRHLVMLIVLFVLFVILTFVFSRWLFNLTEWSFHSLDDFFGFLWGLGAGLVIAHMVLRVIIESQGSNGMVLPDLADAPIAREIYYFKTWNALRSLYSRFGMDGI